VKIARVEAIPVAVPVRTPLKMAVATVVVRTCIVVRITTDDGIEGIGESVLATYFSGETLASAVDLIENQFAPALIGRDPGELVAIRTLLRRIAVHNNGARAAVETALHDVAATAAGVPLYEWYGGRVRDSVPTIWHVSGGSAAAHAAEAAAAVEAGYPLVKVKVGSPDYANDVASVHAVREAVGDRTQILLDANQGFDVADAIRFARDTASARPAFLEQPVFREDLVGMAEVAAASPITIAADEGVFTAMDLRTHLHLRAAGAVVVKMMKAAGPIGVREVFAVADAAGIGVHFAGMAGQTSIGAAHAAHLALAVPNLKYGSGISPQYLADDIVVEPMRPIDGHLHPSSAPGVGVQLDEDQLARYRAEP